jgi:hypothetical protein
MPVSAVVLRKLISVVRPDIEITTTIGMRGRGYLKAKARELNRVAQSESVFVLIDLDSRNPCPAELVRTWLHGTTQANMLFRVAVMEVESWVLADRPNCSNFLGVATKLIPADADTIDDPKKFLVNLARRSREKISVLNSFQHRGHPHRLGLHTIQGYRIS